MEEITITFTKEEINALTPIVVGTITEAKKLLGANYGTGNLTLEQLTGTMNILDSLGLKFKPYEEVKPEPKKSKFQQRLDDYLGTHRK